MARVLAIALHDLRSTLADRGALLWMLVLPVVFAGFFGLVIGGATTPSQLVAAVTVVDHDGGPLAAELVAGLHGEGLAVTEVDPSERDTVEHPIRTLVIPEGFSERVRAGTRTTLRLEREPGTSQEAGLMVQARIVRAATRLIARLVASAEPEGGAGAPEDLVTVESRFAGSATITPGGFAQSIPGNAVMFVMLVALTYGAATLSRERTAGVLTRLATTPARRSEIVLGKLAGRLAVAAAQIVVLLAFGVATAPLTGIDLLPQAPLLLLVLLLFAAAVAPLAVLLGVWVSDPDRVASLGVIATLVMAALGGCWWPLEVVSPTLQKAAMVLPTGWTMVALHDVISFGHGLPRLAPPLLVLALFSAAGTILAARLFRLE